MLSSIHKMSSYSKFKWLPLKEVVSHEAEAKRLGVSVIARSPRGFLTAYKNVNGDRGKMSESKVPGRRTYWDKERHSFISRTLGQYNKKKTLRRWLSLVMWAYKPPGDRPEFS
jgi:hypothetical protein